jgi:hypothetical protein
LAVIGWWALTIWNNHADLKDKFTEHRLDVLENYQKKAEHENDMAQIINKLERLGNLELLLAQTYVTKQEIKEIFAEFVERLKEIEKKI